MSERPQYKADNGETGGHGRKLRDVRLVHERNGGENDKNHIGREDIRHNLLNREDAIERALIEMAAVRLRNRLTPDEATH